MKFYKIIFVNLILFAVFFCIVEFLTYKQNLKFCSDYNKTSEFFYPYITNPKINFISNYKKVEYNEINEIESGFRPTYDITQNTVGGGGKKNNSIVIFGCSYAYGAWLKEQETFSYQLQNYTNNIVINRAFSGWGIQHMLFQLRKNDFSSSFDSLKNKITQNDIKYVIYVFIEDHIRRLYIPCSYFDDKFIFYKLNKNNNQLFEKNDIDNLYWHSYINRILYRNYINNKVKEYDLNIQRFVLAHFLESNKLIRKNFPNSKFIIFVYDGDNKIKKIENSLKEENIEIIYLSELSEIDFKEAEFILDEANHPSSKAWNIIVPLLSKSLFE